MEQSMRLRVQTKRKAVVERIHHGVEESLFGQTDDSVDAILTRLRVLRRQLTSNALIRCRVLDVRQMHQREQILAVSGQYLLQQLPTFLQPPKLPLCIPHQPPLRISYWPPPLPPMDPSLPPHPRRPPTRVHRVHVVCHSKDVQQPSAFHAFQRVASAVLEYMLELHCVLLTLYQQVPPCPSAFVSQQMGARVCAPFDGLHV